MPQRMTSSSNGRNTVHTKEMTNILRHFLPLNSQPFELLVSLQQLGACGPQVATHKGATGSETFIFCSKIKKGWSSVPTDHFIKGKLPNF